jgi:hypothetical protein
MMNVKQIKGSIKDVILAPGAPAITHNMYADDLVLFREAQIMKIEEFAKVMEF